MKLDPLQPPGRVTRKARDFEAEIARLRAQGYTLNAIRQALAAAGVHVSISTVQREATRRTVRGPVGAGAGTVESFTTSSAQASVLAAAALSDAADAVRVQDFPSGKDIAEAFARSKSTNPLVRAKEHR